MAFVFLDLLKLNDYVKMIWPLAFLVCNWYLICFSVNWFLYFIQCLKAKNLVNPPTMAIETNFQPYLNNQMEFSQSLSISG